jgi:hypothetical protein
MDIKSILINNLKAHGYTITDKPKEANFMIQANVLQIGKSDLRQIQGALGAGFGGGVGSAVEGAVIGATASAGFGGGGRDMALAGLAVGALGFVADAMVEDTYFSMITDIQLRERPLEGEVITQTQAANLKQGNSTTTNQSISGGKAEWKTYRTRVVSSANKMNLKFEEAQPMLQDALAKSVSGLF